MKHGFKGREGRGTILLLIIILVAVGSKFIYDKALRQRASHQMDELVTEQEPSSTSNELFAFDPNTIELRELMLLGLSKQQSVSIIRYREAGKVFRIKEDLFTCYGISDSLYYALEPYIVIGEEFQFKSKQIAESTIATIPQLERTPPLPLSTFNIDTVGVKYLMATGVLSRRQAEVFVTWRDRSGIYDMEELRNCYVISDSIASLLEPYIIFSPIVEPKLKLVDLNRADSTELISVYGIGAKSCEAILDYRQKLGGFYSVEQLAELKEVTESNFYKIIRQISCDSCDISKIDINFASAKTIKGHPYIDNLTVRKLLKIRGLKGGWSTIEEMIEDEIFNTEEAHRVRPYLLFTGYKPTDSF